MRCLIICLFTTLGLSASDAYPPPRFTDPQRITKLESAFDEIDTIFNRYMKARSIPGMVWGIVIDGRLAHVQSAGVRNRANGDPVTADTVFRIASMTKSFTALAILKLRDDGKLSLEDAVSKWIPEFAANGDADSRHSTHSHPASADARRRLSRRQSVGRPATRQIRRRIDSVVETRHPVFDDAGSQYEYSNYGFGLLGRIVSKASGMPYDRFVQQQILAPLKMTASTLEPSKVPANQRAIGYRRQPDGSYSRSRRCRTGLSAQWEEC